MYSYKYELDFHVVLLELDVRPYMYIHCIKSECVCLFCTAQLRHGSDAFLVLTTDGVHYVLSEQELCDVVCTCQSPQEAADFVTDQALHYGSEDNCTALVVPFGAWGKFAQSKSVQFRFTRSQSSSRYQ